MADDKDHIYYVYLYLNKNGNPYYVGKGKNRRISAKHSNTIVPPVDRRIKVGTKLSQFEAFTLEHRLIETYGRKVDGGLLDNTKVCRWTRHKGWKQSEATKKTISLKNTGKKRTEQQKENYRKPKTAEHAEKIRQANLGRPYDPVRSAKISATLKGRKLSSEALASRVEKFRNTWAKKKQEKVNG